MTKTVSLFIYVPRTVTLNRDKLCRSDSVFRPTSLLSINLTRLNRPILNKTRIILKTLFVVMVTNRSWTTHLSHTTAAITVRGVVVVVVVFVEGGGGLRLDQLVAQDF